MGERPAAEVLAVVDRRPEVPKISFVAHSFIPKVAGIPRIATSEEHPNDSMQSLKNPCKARIDGSEPTNFITVATPHFVLLMLRIMLQMTRKCTHQIVEVGFF